ncbi:unnamed protein product [Paramecium sonneborni]|uniref:RING-type domain-containing protein n=1 Tax=Paramecium sonneborni TaxID=65129 RepID=A0A8S1RDT0_9CILI|nr:unnamed protein product [Paramecium sonneborni]
MISFYLMLNVNQTYRANRIVYPEVPFTNKQSRYSKLKEKRPPNNILNIIILCYNDYFYQYCMLNEASIFWNSDNQSDIFRPENSYLELSLIISDNYIPILPRAIKEGNVLCLILCFYYLIKLFVTLSQYQEIEEPLFSILILIMGLHDVINILHYLIIGILTQYIGSIDVQNFHRQLNLLSLNSSITQIIIQEFISYYRPVNGLLIIDIIEQKSFCFNCTIIKLLHYFISVYTLIIMLFITTETPILIQIYIILLIIYWFIPILMCFVWPFVMLWFIVLRQELYYQQNRNIIIRFYDQLQNIKFRKLKEQRPSMQQNDCPICYEQINESHSVIQLPCHKEHYFHADCCRQWLGRDPRCPLCRYGLEQPKEVALLEFI